MKIIENPNNVNLETVEYTYKIADQGPKGEQGPEGPEGPQGPQGPEGPKGEGVPSGGTQGQVLEKIDSTDYNTQWSDFSVEWGNISGTLSNQTDLQNALDDKADSSTLSNHTSDSTIHYTQSNIDLSNTNNDAGFITGYTVTQSDVTQHEGALSIAWSQLTGVPSLVEDGDNISVLTNDAGYISDITSENLTDLSDVDISTVSDGQILEYNNTSGNWENVTDSFADENHTHSASDVTSGTFSDSRISESNVTQHETSLTITESQISDLSHFTSGDAVSAINNDADHGSTASHNYFSGNYNDLSNKPDLSSLNDTVVEPSQSDFPGTGDSDKVYIAEDTGYMYRWNGSSYTQLTDQTAIWGQITGTLSDQTDLNNALSNKLESVDETDLNFDTATQTELNNHTSDSDAHHVKYTDEEAQDAVGTIMSGSGATSVTYDDAANTITISSTDNDTTYSAGTALNLSGTTFDFNQTLSDSGTNVITGPEDINFTGSNDATVTVSDDADGTATVDVDVTTSSGSSLETQDSGVSLYTDTSVINFDSNLSVTDNGSGSITVDAASSTDTTTDVSQNGTTVVNQTSDINFTSSNDASVSVTDDGDGSVSVDVDVTDTNTTYTAGTGLGLSAQEFSIDSTVIQSGDNVSELTNDAGYITSTLSKENVQDDAWDVLTGTQSLISVNYDDANNEVDFTVTDDLSQYDNSTSGFISSEQNDLTSSVTWANVPDTNITESSVTQHESALSITESQISDLSHTTEEDVDDWVNNLLVGGSNVTLTYDDAGNSLTIDSSDTDTTYSAGTALSLSGTTFNFNQTLSQSGTSTITGAEDINFTSSNDATVTVTDDGDGTATVDVDVTDTNTTYTAGTGIDLTSQQFSIDSTVIQSGDNISELNNDSGFISDITGENIGTLNDVSITSATSGDFIKYNGTSWVNQDADLRNLSDVNDSTLSDNDILTYNSNNNDFDWFALSSLAGDNLTWDSTNNELDATVSGGDVNNKVYHGSFVISGTGNINITGLPFAPNQVQFKASLPVDAESLTGKSGDNSNDDSGFAGNMFGFARQSDGTQKAMSTGGSGASINNVRYGASTSKSIYATYGNANGAEVARIEGTVSSWNSDGITVNIDTYSSVSTDMAGQVVHFVAYKSEELSTSATNVSDSGSQVETSVGDINFDSNLSVTNDGDGTVTIDASSGSNGVDVSDNGTLSVSGATDINFSSNLTVTDDTDGTVTVDASTGTTANNKGVVVHGSDATVSRPTGYDSIEWQGSVEPNNANNDDTWIDTS